MYTYKDKKKEVLLRPPQITLQGTLKASLRVSLPETSS